MRRNVQRLGSAISDRMKSTSKAANPVAVELGTINNDLSLSVDSVKTKIPKGSYMVDITLSGNSYQTSSESHSHSGGTHEGHESGNGSHDHIGGSHSHALPSVFRALKAGDRVLVIWCGFNPIVVSIVTKS